MSDPDASDPGASDLGRARMIRFVVHGRVQGVAFRAYTRDTARGLDLAGHVLNRQDGSVAGVAYGPSDKIAELIAFLHEGSPWARVERVEIQDVDIGAVEELPAQFQVQRG